MNSINLAKSSLLLNELLESQRKLLAAPQKQDAHEPDWLSSMSTAFSRTVSRACLADVRDFVAIADKIMDRSARCGMQFDSDPSMAVGTIAVTHEKVPRFVPVRAKYDTGSDINFIAAGFLLKHNLSSRLQKLPMSDCFDGLNGHQYHVSDTITLNWCASTMDTVRETQFHVVEEVPFDIILGNPFIMANRVFKPTKVALPCKFPSHFAGKYS